jgi:hypothetical protein
MVFHYFDHEIEDHEESFLDVFKSTDGRVTWSRLHPTRDLANNTLSLSGITSFSDWTASDGVNSSLPIELIDFTANVSDFGIELVWETASETNNDFFTIERSIDGITWETVSHIPGSGNSSFINEYAYTDTYFLSEIHYYRLKQTDYDGASSFSKIISVYPHQIQNGISITYSKIKQTISIVCSDEKLCNSIKFIDFLNVNGQLIYKTNQKMLSSHAIAPGVYFVYIQTLESFVTSTILID